MTTPTAPQSPTASPPPVPPAKKSRRKWPWVVGGVVALFFIIGIANSGNTSTPSTATAPAATPIPAQQGAAGPDNPTAQKAEVTFLVDLQTAGVPLTSQSTLTGYAVCVVLKNGTSQDSAAKQTATTAHLTSQQSTDLVTAANRDLCSLIK